MNTIVLDFETYYDNDYSLSKMSTEEYVTDPRFEVIGVGVKINDATPLWYSGTHDKIGSWLRGIGVWDAIVVAHNARFDMLILKHLYNKLPPVMLDTMGMAQVFIKPFHRSISLASCAELLEIGEKGGFVNDARGRHRQSFSPDELAAYGEYCKNDCELEHKLFHHLLPKFPADELHIMDLTLRMYLEPKLALDPEILAENLQLVVAQKAAQLAALPAAYTKDRLSSNPKFAELLIELGIEPPQKISKTTGEITFAFAKNDMGWKELEEAYIDDPLVSAVLTARLGAKSTLEETRSKRLLDIANRYGWFRVPLRYYAAHTGRYGGDESINATNLPQTRRSKMRSAVYAPEGSVVVAADLAQIEARITAVLAGCTEISDAFARGADIYSEFASVVFKQEVAKGRSDRDNQMRFAGKTCILGLQYGMSDKVLQSTLRKDNLKYELTTCATMVSTYRQKYRAIPLLWDKLDRGLTIMRQTPAAYMRVGPVTLGAAQVILPNNMPLTYPSLRYGEESRQVYYDFAGMRRSIWGGKLLENIVQALARILVMSYMLKIRAATGHAPVLQQHDELDYVIALRELEAFIATANEIMTVPPDWMLNLPVAVEINYGQTLADCK